MKSSSSKIQITFKGTFHFISEHLWILNDSVFIALHTGCAKRHLSSFQFSLYVGLLYLHTTGWKCLQQNRVSEREGEHFFDTINKNTTYWNMFKGLIVHFSIETSSKPLDINLMNNELTELISDKSIKIRAQLYILKKCYSAPFLKFLSSYYYYFNNNLEMFYLVSTGKDLRDSEPCGFSSCLLPDVKLTWCHTQIAALCLSSIRSRW